MLPFFVEVLAECAVGLLVGARLVGMLGVKGLKFVNFQVGNSLGLSWWGDRVKTHCAWVFHVGASQGHTSGAAVGGWLESGSFLTRLEAKAMQTGWSGMEGNEQGESKRVLQ